MSVPTCNFAYTAKFFIRSMKQASEDRLKDLLLASDRYDYMYSSVQVLVRDSNDRKRSNSLLQPHTHSADHSTLKSLNAGTGQLILHVSYFI